MTNVRPLTTGNTITGPITPEVLSQTALTQYLDGIGNVEAKLPVTAIMASEPDHWFTTTELWNELKQRQGTTPGWEMDRNMAASYCQKSLGPVGLVVKGTVRTHRGHVAAFKAEPEVADAALAFTGTLMEWSLEHPETSVQKIFGPTSSNGNHRAPELRYEILKHVAKHESTTDLSAVEIVNALANDDTSSGAVYIALRRLDEVGILSNTIVNSANHKAEIVDPDFSHVALKLEDLTVETQAFYSAVGSIANNGITELSFDRLAEAVLATNPDIDKLKLRHLWSQAMSKDHVFPGVQEIERPFLNRSVKSKIELNPETKDAVEELLYRLELLTTSPSDAASFKQTALRLITEPASMAQLFGKSRHFSANVAAKVEYPAKDKIISIIQQLGSATVDMVHEHAKHNGLKIARSSTADIMNMLAKQGLVSHEPVRVDPYSKRETAQYTLIKPENQ